MRNTVLIESWQMQCCGTPFKIGDTIEWFVVEWEDEKLPIDIGKIDYLYEHHGENDAQLLKLKGNVISITAIHYAYQKSEESSLMIPVSGITVEKQQADGWDKKINEMDLYGYYVCLENASEVINT